MSYGGPCLDCNSYRHVHRCPAVVVAGRCHCYGCGRGGHVFMLDPRTQVVRCLDCETALGQDGCLEWFQAP
jgi:hypothetical protein